MEAINLFDGHCDTLLRNYERHSPDYAGGSLRRNRGHVDLERAHGCFGRYAQFFAVFADTDTWPGKSLHQMFLEQYGLFRRTMEENSDLVRPCRTAKEAEAAFADGRCAACLSVEGAQILDCDLEKLEDAWRKGVRMVNLTWNYENALSGSNDESPEKGLTEQGRAFVRRMQALGMIVDVSHLSDPGFWDVAQLAEEAGKPFVASHSNARAVCSHKRNLTDEQFTAIIKNQGVAGLNMCGLFLGGNPTLDTVVAHIEHFMALGGERNVAIGGDWDGCTMFPGMAQITDIGALYERLLRLNYRETVVRDVFYNNLMRVVSDVCTM